MSRRQQTGIRFIGLAAHAKQSSMCNHSCVGRQGRRHSQANTVTYFFNQWANSEGDHVQVQPARQTQQLFGCDHMGYDQHWQVQRQAPPRDTMPVCCPSTPFGAAVPPPAAAHHTTTVTAGRDASAAVLCPCCTPDVGNAECLVLHVL